VDEVYRNIRTVSIPEDELATKPGGLIHEMIDMLLQYQAVLTAMADDEQLITKYAPPRWAG